MDVLKVSTDLSGALHLTLNQQAILGGFPTLSGLTPTVMAGSIDASNPSLKQFYAEKNLMADWDFRLSGGDLIIDCTISNCGHTASDPIVLAIPPFVFEETPTGTLMAWHWTYLVARGLELYHPSYMQPIGCVMASDSKYGVSIWSPSEKNKQILFNADFIQDGVLPNPLPIRAYTTVVVQPGRSQKVTLQLRIASDHSYQNLLINYKKSIPALTYLPVKKGAVAAQAIDASWVTPENPYGYNGDERRIDTVEGVKKYLAWQIPRLQARNCVGIIFWAPGGFWPTSMYPVDYDVNLKRISATWPALVKGFKDAGFRVGIAARFGDSLNPGSGRSDPKNPADVKELLKRIDYVAGTGVDLWYIDTAGMYWNDIKMVELARKHLGSKHLFYTEYATDVGMVNAGLYLEWLGSGTRWFSENTRAQLRYLFDDKANMLCVDKSAPDNGPTHGTDLSALGFQTLVGDWTAEG